MKNIKLVQTIMQTGDHVIINLKYAKTLTKEQLEFIIKYELTHHSVKSKHT